MNLLTIDQLNKPIPEPSVNWDGSPRLPEGPRIAIEPRRRIKVRKHNGAWKVLFPLMHGYVPLEHAVRFPTWRQAIDYAISHS